MFFFCAPQGKAQEARFVEEAFKMWDRHGAHIDLMEFTWLHEQPVSALQGYARYYDLHETGFLTFLGTLGLRSYDGTDKPAFSQLVQESGARGW